MKTTITISEIFGPTIQGEGALIGRPTVFVRTGSCDFRCSWCDTLYAVLPEFRDTWQEMEAEAILGEVSRLANARPLLVTLSGGNPAMQPLEPLLSIGREKGYSFALETQGSIARPWFSLLDYLVLSPKPPSSGMPINRERLHACLRASGSATTTILKMVVFDETDYLCAQDIHREFPDYPFYLQPGNHSPQQIFSGADDLLDIDVAGIAARTEWLLHRALADGWNDVTVLPQLHTLLWGNKRSV